MDVRPKPLFQGDVNSADSHVGDNNNNNNHSEVNETIAQETMPTQARA
jgi:hypothetical protein